MLKYKKFVPCIYLHQKNAVTSLTDTTIISMNACELARFYSDHNADEILVFDMSTEDAEHEENLSVIKHMAESVAVPFLGAGHVKRMEDIKKLLYAGCKKAVLDLSLESNIEIMKEVSLKFGQDKLVGAFSDLNTLSTYQEALNEFVSELLVMEEAVLKESLSISQIPMLAMLPSISLDKMLQVMGREGISGITGTFVNENIKEIPTLKQLCKENGVLVNTLEPTLQWSDFKLNADGMMPIVVQDYKTNEVLMVAYMTEESYQLTLQTGKMTYYSRSRNELWVKGDTSGHYQYVKSLTADCDLDTILAKVSQVGAACHTGHYSCFFNELVKTDDTETNPLQVFERVSDVIKDRKLHPKEGSYTNYLFDKGIDKILKKLGEEATEIVIAAKNPNPDEIKYEISDFLYHMMVLMVEKDVTWEEITQELAQR
ncbi:MAG: bifunctional phosphoribosyl-AMP cyclohydrolase/phosphoribosyl-ATP diphosphatase HisIE [Lachnospiraceae bacterium]